MRFARWSRVEPYVETSRKRAAVLTSQRRVRDKHPLLGPLIAEQQPSVDDVMASRARSWPRWQQQRRAARAANWRPARRHLWSLAPSLRAQVRTLWNEAPYPADPRYLLDFLHGIATGRIDPSQPPWRYDEVERARVAARLEAWVKHGPGAQSPQDPQTKQTRRAVIVRKSGFLPSGDHE